MLGGEFFRTVSGFLGNVPVLGPCVRGVRGWMGGGSSGGWASGGRGGELPV